MKKLIFIDVVLAIALFFTGFIYLDNRDVHIIDVHLTDYSATFVVDRMPILDKKKIAWWIQNQVSILDKHHINPPGKRGRLYYYFYEIGEGYQPLGREDRICFDDMPEPNNCLDKGWLMAVWPTRDNKSEFIMDSGSYQLDKQGNIQKIKK